MFDVLFYLLYYGLCFRIAVDSDAPTLDKFQDLQVQDFEQFKQQGKSP
jgi:hypothetical protein